MTRRSHATSGTASRASSSTPEPARRRPVDDVRRPPRSPASLARSADPPLTAPRIIPCRRYLKCAAGDRSVIVGAAASPSDGRFHGEAVGPPSLEAADDVGGPPQPGSCSVAAARLVAHPRCRGAPRGGRRVGLGDPRVAPGSRRHSSTLRSMTRAPGTRPSRCRCSEGRTSTSRAPAVSAAPLHRRAASVGGAPRRARVDPTRPASSDPPGARPRPPPIAGPTP